MGFEAHAPLLLPGPGIIPILQMKQPRVGTKGLGVTKPLWGGAGGNGRDLGSDPQF